MKRIKPIQLLIGFGIFLFFVFLTFPYQNLRGYIFGKIHSATKILIVAEDIYPTLLGWPGVVIKNATVTAPLGNSDIELSSDKMVFRVGIGGLLPPSPALSLFIKKLKKGGDLYVKFSQSGGSTSSAVEADAVDMRQLEFSALPEPIQGVLDLTGDFTYEEKDFSKSTGQMNLDLKGLKVPAQNLQGIILPALNVGPLKAKIAIKNGNAEISSFQFGGPDSDVTGSIAGDLRLGEHPMNSFLNLTLRLQFSDQFRQNPQAAILVSLVESFKGEQGDYAMKWSATLQDISTNIMSAIPQKVTTN